MHWGSDSFLPLEGKWLLHLWSMNEVWANISTYQHLIWFQYLCSNKQQAKQYFLIPHLDPWCAMLLQLGRLIFILIMDTEYFYWIWQMNHQQGVCNIYFHIQYLATTYMSHSYHSNHKMLYFVKSSSMLKPLPGELSREVMQRARTTSECIHKWLCEQGLW